MEERNHEKILKNMGLKSSLLYFRWSNIGLDGQFIYKVDESEIKEPDTDLSKYLY